MILSKTLKTTFLTLSIATIALTAHAQDKIYKRDGTVIDAKVKAVGETTVIYKRTDNLEGPEYTILETDITKIIYANGQADVFKDGDKRVGKKGRNNGTTKNVKYGKNIFAIIPAAYVASADGTINDVAIGISYERLLDRHGHIGFNLPVMLAFSSGRDFSNSIVTVNGSNLNYGNYTSVYFMPGIKFYPAPDRLRVRYSIGASLFAILGGEPGAVHDANSATGNYNQATGTYVYSSGTYHYAMYGFMLSNSVNITATKHLFMSVDLGAGVPFADNRYATGESLGIPVPFIQIGFKVGYRYGS